MNHLRARATGSTGFVAECIEDVTGTHSSKVDHVEWVLDYDWAIILRRMIANADELAALSAVAAGVPVHKSPAIRPAWLTLAAADLAKLPLDDYGTLGAHQRDGVRIRPTDYDKFAVVMPFHIDVTDEQKQRVIHGALTHVGDHYSIREILGDFLHTELSEPTNEEDCSVFFAMTANLGVPIIRPIDGMKLITPRDILTSEVIVLD